MPRRQPLDLDALLSAATLDQLGRPAAARMLRELVRAPAAGKEPAQQPAPPGSGLDARSWALYRGGC